MTNPLGYPAAPGNAFIPNWEPPARVVPDPLPGTKRYVLLNADGTLAGETDDLQEAVAVIGSGRVDLSLHKRGATINQYVKVTPVDKRAEEWIRQQKQETQL